MKKHYIHRIAKNPKMFHEWFSSYNARGKGHIKIVNSIVFSCFSYLCKVVHRIFCILHGNHQRTSKTALQCLLYNLIIKENPLSMRQKSSTYIDLMFIIKKIHLPSTMAIRLP